MKSNTNRATLLVLSVLCLTTQHLSANYMDAFTMMDTDKNEALSQEEFLGSWQHINDHRDVDKDQLMSRVEYGADSIFDHVDTNKDGYISFEEDRNLRVTHFTATDKNSDGIVTLAEFAGVHEVNLAAAASKPSFKTVPQTDAHRQAFSKVDALAGLTEAPQLWLAEGYEATDTLAAIYYDALDWNGQPTKVFAWLGLPDVPKGQKVPGVVLVHGGGGTAFKEWVTQWTDRGYAAISIAVEGQTDVSNSAGSPHSPWQQHEWPGPQRSGIYQDSDLQLEQQWMYHAVADVILANSLLRSLPEVDADQVGVMGISWGGVITSTVIGIDDRFAFAIPVYGCGSLADAENSYGTALGQNGVYQHVWDPALRISRAQTPTLWFSWPGDSHFPLDNQAACYQAQAGSHMVSLVPDMGHGHGLGWKRPESYAFADSVIAGQPWCVEVGDKYEQQISYVDFRSTAELEQATLVWTPDTGATGARKWIQQEGTLRRQGDVWTAFALVPEQATAYFMNVRSGEVTASSGFKEFQ